MLVLARWEHLASQNRRRRGAAGPDTSATLSA